MQVAPGKLFKACYGKYAIAAVNIWSMEQVIALFSAAAKSRAPFIVATTPAARNYAGPGMILSMIRAAHEMFPDAVFAVHLDHGNDMHTITAIEKGGYNSVMIDASHDPYKKNIQLTKQIVTMAHAKGIEVEAELGVLRGVEDDLVSNKSRYTQPGEVVDFVNRTHCDSLAVAVGTSHGAYKFSGGQGLQFEILNKIQQKLPGFPLVLHGGSAINTDEIRRINVAGGNIKSTAKGVDPEELKKAISLGICKVNIATDARLIWSRVHREFFKESPELIDPVVPGKKYMEELGKFLKEKFELLNAAGQANNILLKNQSL